MAVRIALQCSEADAHLILSEDNTAARLLSRPGEAIYNDANGLVEGNNPFQVVWLADEQPRGATCAQLRELAAQRRRPPPPPIVFEGNAPADVSKNRPARPAAAGAGGGASDGQRAGLAGEAMAIKDPTAGGVPPPERQQPADRRPAARGGTGMLVTALVSLAAHGSPGAARSIPRFVVARSTGETASASPPGWSISVNTTPVTTSESTNGAKYRTRSSARPCRRAFSISATPSANGSCSASESTMKIAVVLQRADEDVVAERALEVLQPDEVVERPEPVPVVAAVVRSPAAPAR